MRVSCMMLRGRSVRMLLFVLIFFVCAPFVSRAQAVNDLLIQMLDYSYNCQTGMATVKYHITNSDASGHVGGYNTNYTINLGVYSTSGFIANGDDDVEFTGGYIIGDMIECRAYGVGNNFTYPMTFDYEGYLPRPAKPYIFPFASTVTTCSGQPVTLYAHNATGNPATFIWSNGQTGASIEVSSAGTYTVQEAGSCGNSDPSDPIVVNIGAAPPPPSVTASPQTVLCNGGSTGLYTAPTGGGTIHWNTGETGNSITVSSPGTYYAYEVNGCGQSGNSNSVRITSINTSGAPVVSAGSTLLCNGASTTITATPLYGGTIYWNTGQTGNSITVSGAGSYYVYEGTACGTTNYSNTVTITTASSPAAPSISSSGTLVCNGSPVTISASSSGGMVHWNTGATGGSISVSSAGTYYAYESNACGNSGNSNSVVVSSSLTPPPPSLNVTGSITLCDGAGQVLTASPSAGGTIYWSNGATGNSITIYTAGAYYAYESNSCGNGPASATVNISTLSRPVAPTVTPPGSQLLCNGQTATLSASGSNITWNNGATGTTLVTGVAGTYYAYANNYCGNSPNSNAVVIATGNCPMPSPGTSFFICPGALKTLDAGAGYDTYAWSNGATTRNISVGPGNYAVTVTKDGCSATSVTVSVSYYVVTTPVINASGAITFCAGNSVTLSSSTASAYLWSNGSTGSSINVTTSGNYYVTTTDGNGCVATSVPVTVTVNALATASVAGTTSVCKNGAAPSVVFTGNGGTAPYTFYYNINGGATQTVTSASASVAVSVPTSTAGVFTYNLLGVRESSGTACYNDQGGSAVVTVRDLPNAVIEGTATVCLNSSSPMVTFTGSNGTAPYSFTYNINGGTAQTVTTVSGNSVGVVVPTGVAGSFAYNLLSVQEASGLACSNAVNGTATIVVRALPVASISGNTSVCQNSAAPPIVFTGSGGTAPYTFGYRINGGAVQTVTTVSGNTVSVAAPTDAVGTFSYALVNVQESGTGSCVNAASGNVTVIVNPLPAATISGAATVCQNSASPVVTFTGSNATAPYTFSYRINGGAVQTVTTTSGNSVSVSVPTNVAGDFTYSLISVQDASSTACVKAVSGDVMVAVRALPTATISGNTAVCMNSAKPMVTFTGATGNAPYTFSYTINGGSVQTVTTTSGNSVSVEMPTNTAGTFVYALVGVQESGTGNCSNAASGTATVVVNPLPAATISGNLIVCQNSAAPSVVFTGSNATSPYTFTYRINGGAAQTVTTVSGNSVPVAVPTNVAGSFTYSLVNVKESSGTACENAASGSVTVTVNAQPAAAVLLSPNTHLCNGETGQLTIYNWTEGFTYTWFKDGALLTTSTAQTLSITQAGTYTVIVTSQLGCDAASVSNAVIITVGSIAQPVITGSLKVCEGGKTMLVALPKDKSKLYEIYRWTDTPIGDTLSMSKSFSALAGQYLLFVKREGCFDSTLVTVTANDTEYPAGRLIVTPSQVAYGGRAKLTADVKGAVQYEWDVGGKIDALTAASSVDQNFFIRSDSVRVKVRAISERNCISEFTACVKIGKPDTLLFADKSFAGNLKDWNLFPVPFHDELKLSVILKRNETVRVDLFTADGSWIRYWERKGFKGENLFTLDNISSLASGVLYFVTAVYNGEKHFDKIYKY